MGWRLRLPAARGGRAPRWPHTWARRRGRRRARRRRGRRSRRHCPRGSARSGRRGRCRALAGCTARAAAAAQPPTRRTAWRRRRRGRRRRRRRLQRPVAQGLRLLSPARLPSCATRCWARCCSCWASRSRSCPRHSPPSASQRRRRLVAEMSMHFRHTGSPAETVAQPRNAPASAASSAPSPAVDIAALRSQAVGLAASSCQCSLQLPHGADSARRVAVERARSSEAAGRLFVRTCSGVLGRIRPRVCLKRYERGENEGPGKCAAIWRRRQGRCQRSGSNCGSSSSEAQQDSSVLTVRAASACTPVCADAAQQRGDVELSKTGTACPHPPPSAARAATPPAAPAPARPSA